MDPVVDFMAAIQDRLKMCLEAPEILWLRLFLLVKDALSKI